MELKQLVAINGRVSSSQVWFHITNACILITYLLFAYRIGFGENVSTSAIEAMSWLTVVISGIITSNKFANVFIHLRPPKNDVENSTK